MNGFLIMVEDKEELKDAEKMVNKSGFFKTEEFHRAPKEMAKGVLRMSSVMVGNTNVPVSSVLGVQIKDDDFIYMFEKPAKEGV